MKSCSVCKAHLELSNFYKNKRTKDGYQLSCKKCADKSNTASRHKHPENARRVRKVYQEASVAEVSAWKESFGCLHCDETAGACLDLHHLDPNIKDENPSYYARSSLKRFLLEAMKCVILCKNCHTKVHADLIVLDTNKVLAFQRSNGWA